MGQGTDAGDGSQMKIAMHYLYSTWIANNRTGGSTAAPLEIQTCNMVCNRSVGFGRWERDGGADNDLDALSPYANTGPTTGTASS